MKNFLSSSYIKIALVCAFALSVLLPLSAQTCGNNSKKGVTTDPENKAGDPFDAYTGNDYREVDDLQIWGGVGEHQLKFTRYGMSRYQAGSIFGTGYTWRHSYLWSMGPAGTNSLGQAQMQVQYPDGATVLFANTATNLWTADPSIPDVIFQSGSGSSATYIIQRKDGWRYHFSMGSVGWLLMDSFTDNMGSVYNVTYNTNGRVTRVTEPGGRHLDLTYSTLSVTNSTAYQLAKITALPSDGVWVTLPVTDTHAFRFLTYQGPNLGYCDIAEVQFYNTGGTLLTGTTIGGGPAASPSTDYSKATDGNPATYFDSSVSSGSFVGIDLGAGNATVIGSVKFLCRTGYGSRMYGSNGGGKFIAYNQFPSTIVAMSGVSSSDGRSVTYNYSSFTDPSIPNVYQTLTSVTYGDSTSASYTYTQQYPGTTPLVETASDPRYTPKCNFVAVKNTYMTGGAPVLGYISSQVDTGDGHFLAGLASGASFDGASPVLYPGSRTENYSMNNLSGQHVGWTDAAGHSVLFAYNHSSGTSGFEVSHTDRRGHLWARVPSAFDNPTSKTAPNGDAISWTRDSLDLPLTFVDGRSHTTTYTRDGSHRITRVDYPDSSYETYTYNSFNEVLTHRLRNGGSESFTYGLTGLMTGKTDAESHSWTYTYDSHDRMASVTDPLSHTTAYQYNEKGLVTLVTYADSTTVSYTYDSYGNCLTRTNELGKTWTYTYNNYRQMTSMTDPLSRTTNYTWNTPYTAEPDQTILPSGKIINRTFDANFRKITETVGYGTADAATTTYAYDNVGNVTSITDPRSKVTSYTYDTKNRRLTMTDPLSHTTSYTYDANDNVLTVTRPDSGVTTNVYDTMNRLTQTTDPKSQVTSYTYDGAGNLLTMTDPNSHTYTYTYDLLNRKTSLTYPGGSVESYTYDAAGNLYTYTTRGGKTKTSTYDSRNRETAYTWSDSTPGVTRTYDYAGKLLTSGNGVSTSTYVYDFANQLSSEAQADVSAGVTRTVSYTYNSDGNRATTTYPSGTVIGYTYTNRNQVATITVGGTTVATYTYDADGNPLTKTLADGTVATSTYDNASRLTSLNHTLSSTSFARFDYGYDNVNRRTYEKRDSALGDAYSYDAIDQVASVQYDATNPDTTPTSPARTSAYTYDNAGNRSLLLETVGATTGTTSYTANNLNQYTAVGVMTPTYDTNGNLVSGPGAFTYDSQNRLTSAAAGLYADDFFYDSKNRVVERDINGTPTYFIYDSWNLIEERNGAGTLLATYVYGIRVDELIRKTDASSTVYYHHNALGNVIALTNTSGGVVEKYKYDAFGKPSFFDGSGTPLSATAYGNRFLFTGREYLAEIGLYDYRSRVYSADIGRFLQTDLMSFSAGDVNIYRYCGNSPINLIDPQGKNPLLIILGVAVAGVAIYEGYEALNNYYEQAQQYGDSLQTRNDAISSGQADAAQQAINQSNDALAATLQDAAKAATTMPDTLATGPLTVSTELNEIALDVAKEETLKKVREGVLESGHENPQPPPSPPPSPDPRPLPIDPDNTPISPHMPSPDIRPLPDDHIGCPPNQYPPKIG